MATTNPIHILTFLTRSQRCCYYATGTDPLGGVPLAPPRLPGQIEAQLDALGAQVAWICSGEPGDIRVMGPAHAYCDPVTSVSDDEVGHLIVCSPAGVGPTPLPLAG